MHYILLAVALNLGKKDIDLIKINDLKSSVNIESTTSKEENKKQDEQAFPESDYAVGQNVISDNSFSQPYVGSDNFAELLPEDEFGNVVKTNEEQGPKIVDKVKNKIMDTIDTGKSPETESKPTFLDSVKEKLMTDNKDTTTKKNKDYVVDEESEGPTFFENIKNKLFGEPQKTEVKKETTIVAKEPVKQVAKDTKKSETTLLNTIKDKTTQITNKVVDKTKNEAKPLPEKEEILTDDEPKEEKVKIVGTLFDSELKNALKDEDKIRSKETKENQRYKNSKANVEYVEDEDYQKFLDEKEIKTLVEPDKIDVPLLIPQEKKNKKYRNDDIPEELIADRSFQNRHIPKITMNEDKEKVLEKIIEYGMITEFRAFMNDLKDANFVMSNQYTLLSYATKYKQHEIMRYLIHIGANVNKRDDRLETPLFLAVQNNDMEAAKILINANANLNALDILRRTPLIYTIEKGQEAMGIFLIDNGADVNIANGVGEGTLSMSIRLGRNAVKERIIRVLRKNEK